MGIERSWTQEIVNPNTGMPFLIRHIIMDEETTHNATQGCAYYYDASSPTGMKPAQAKDSSVSCPDLDILEDFEQDHPERVFYGDSQLEWLRAELLKPADLIFITTGGPNWEIDYGYNSITEFPAEKRKLIQILRETGAEHVIWLTGDSHASYVTKAPHIVGYPMYTIVGSGLTSGVSYDRYIAFWGDISHRFLVAAGSTNLNDKAASFAEVDVAFDEEGAYVKFTPHLRKESTTGEGWGPWYAQTEKNADEPWDAQYTIRVSDLEIAKDFPRYHYDNSLEHKFVVENVYLKWENSTGAAEELEVTVSLKSNLQCVRFRFCCM